ncbi:DUF3157 family protein [Gallaecimonas kandeliae]|uniref:DUF3157 family protein n=1 Tax=Gallaecimonas kandeliae TaxID=3029055 RepID=UPI0026494443|nr:DUF3157 family protein [Gallaecimonas kandeliae]WKE64933.1 DUF3157 family protein [Gallaecimonas kandeliae]
MLKRFAEAALLLGLASTAHAAEVARVKLPNGALVSLKDDFTWEYVLMAEKDKGLAPAVLAKPELLGATAKDGVKVRLAHHRWDGERLGLTFGLENQNTENVVKVLAEVSFYGDDGKLLKQQELTLWQAEYRLPDSYLRQGQDRDSRELWVEGISPTQWQKGLLALKVKKLEFR